MGYLSLFSPITGLMFVLLMLSHISLIVTDDSSGVVSDSASVSDMLDSTSTILPSEAEMTPGDMISGTPAMDTQTPVLEEPIVTSVQMEDSTQFTTSPMEESTQFPILIDPTSAESMSSTSVVEIVSACDSAPCKNGGNCSEMESTFTCSCEGTGWSGITCETDVDECTNSTLNNCADDAGCENTDGSFTCKCNYGYIGNGTFCEDQDECLNQTLYECDEFAYCNNTIGGYNCTCNPGYEGGGKICKDVNECNEDELNDCPELTDCKNTEGGFTCDCKPGYEGDRSNCTDIDECKDDTDDCHEFADCANNNGSFTCQCKPGYSGNGKTCSDIDECTDEATHECIEWARCNNTEGGYTCVCKPGFTGDGTTCSDIDECSNSSLYMCHEFADCINNNGSYTCQCSEGFTGDGKDSCVRIDMCKISPCENGGFCHNKPTGGAACMCVPGWTGDKCETDIDECTNTPEPCDLNADCKNLNGSYECTCNDGYHGNGKQCIEKLIYADGKENQTMRALGSVDTLYGPYQLGGGQPSVYVHMNGYVVVGERYAAPYPNDMDDVVDFPANLYAPFWTSIDTSEGVGKLVISNIKDREQLDVIKAALPDGSTELLQAGVLASWHKVNPVPASSYQDKEVLTFQVVVVTDWIKSWIIFNYDIESLTWDPESDLNRTILVGTIKKGDKFDVLARYPEEDGVLSAYEIDTSPGNTASNKIGRWVFNVVSTPDLIIGECQIWFAGLNQTQISESIHSAAPCPCTSDQAQSDLNYWYDVSTHTATPLFGVKQTCKYNSEYFYLETGYPDGGYPKVPDVDVGQTNGKELCCVNSTQCDLFYKAFPSDDCSNYQPPVHAVSWGDPHIKTLRETQYTFNGQGEFVHWMTGSFEIQCRTSRVSASMGNATEFTAFAMQAEGSDKVELRFNLGTSNIDLAVNGILEPGIAVGTRDVKNGVVIIKTTDTQYRVSFLSGINFMVSAGLSNLQLSVMVNPVLLDTDSSGLIAITKDKKFQFRNRTLLPSDSSEADLFQFGMSWQTNSSDSLFTYALDAGKSFDDFNPVDVFVPPFYSDMPIEEQFPNETVRDAAVALCGMTPACLVDYAATQDSSFANQTKNEQTEAEATKSKLENNPPKFVDMPPQLRLTVGKKTTINLSATDPDTNDEVTFIFSTADLPPVAVQFETDNETFITLTATYHTRNTSLKLRILATDGRGGVAEYWPDLSVCACRNKSECLSSTKNPPNINHESERFSVEMCGCQNGYEGEFCTDQFDICLSDQPCYLGVNCTSDTGEFTCGACPQGLEGDGQSCSDTNECLTVHDCEHICSNLPGSYKCSCNPGFTLDKNMKNCTDIDECVSSPCGSGEFCENTEGSFNCKCIPGYFNRTGTCQKDLNVRQYSLTIKFKPTTPDQMWDEKLKDPKSTEFMNLAELVKTSVIPYINLSSFDSVRVEAFSKGSVVAHTVASYDEDIKSSDLKTLIESVLVGCAENCLMGALLIPSIDDDIIFTVKDFCEGINNDCDEISTDCVNTNGSFRCDCKDGFKNSAFYKNRCDDINECTVDKPCGEATCTNTPGSYTCHCSDTNKDYKDDKCVDKCYGSPCKNDGTCMIVQDTFACKCTEKWTGGTCEEAAEQSYKTTLIIVASVVGSICLIAIIVIVVMCLRRRTQSKSYSGVYETGSSLDDESVTYQGWGGKIPRPKRNQPDGRDGGLEMVENGNRNNVSEYDELRMDDPSKPLTAGGNKTVEGHDNPTFTGGATNGNNPQGRKSGNEYF